jgi:uncharacterized Zn-binding protein involved in type VI secretion
MPHAAYVGSVTQGIGDHGLECCPHVVTGVIAQGSPDTFGEGKALARANIDFAPHDCPHCPTSFIVQGSPDVFVNGYPLHRVGDFLDMT